MPFRFERMEIPDVVLVEAQRIVDDRGSFMETYRRSQFAAHGITDLLVQDNYSHSVRGALRGLHYQKHPKAQSKLVGVIQGEIFDVAVDIRRGSPTYGYWVSAVLSAANGRMLYVPVGFAHGFCVLSEEADVVYKVAEEYVPDLERGIIWNDSDLAIAWPVDDPILSPKDLALPALCEADNNFHFEEVA